MFKLQRVPAECSARPYNLVRQFLQVVIVIVGLANYPSIILTGSFSLNVFPSFLTFYFQSEMRPLSWFSSRLASSGQVRMASLSPEYKSISHKLISHKNGEFDRHLQGAGWDRDHDRSSQLSGSPQINLQSLEDAHVQCSSPLISSQRRSLFWRSQSPGGVWLVQEPRHHWLPKADALHW